MAAASEPNSNGRPPRRASLECQALTEREKDTCCGWEITWQFLTGGLKTMPTFGKYLCCSFYRNAITIQNDTCRGFEPSSKARHEDVSEVSTQCLHLFISWVGPGQIEMIGQQRGKNKVMRRNRRENLFHWKYVKIFVQLAVDTNDGQHIAPFPNTIPKQDETRDRVEMPKGSVTWQPDTIPATWKFDGWRDRFVGVFLPTAPTTLRWPRREVV